MTKEKTEQPRLKKLYEEKIISAMMEEFGLKNKLAVPKIEKISINVGVGKLASKDAKVIDSISEDIAKIAGQKPVITKARKSIAGFKLRDGMPVGVSVTIRGNRMYEFLDRLISVAIPRIRDFRGANKDAFDKQGNYSMGLKEHSVFPEVKVETIESIHGMQVNIKMNKKDRDMGHALLKHFGFPFKK